MANVRTFETGDAGEAPRAPSSLVLPVLAIVLYLCVAGIALVRPIIDTSDDANASGTEFIAP